MSMSNSRQAYGWISIALHWLAAISILVLYLNGEAIEDAVGRDGHIAAVMAHVSLGMALFVLLAARVVWSLASRKPDPFPQNRWLRALSLLIHWLLLAAIVVALVTGPLAIWAVGRPLSVYSLQIPSPWTRPDREFHELMEQVHGWAAHAFLPLVALHVLGALKHLIFDKDRTLQRMIWVRQSRGDS